MSAVLEIGNRTITAAAIIPLLASYEMTPQFLRENIVDQAIAPFTCTPAETAIACQQFCQRNQLRSDTELQAWLHRYRISSDQLAAIATRKLRIAKFKQATWGNKLKSYFLKRKGQLDKVIYSLLTIKDTEIAQELYFRIQAGEQSFSELAQAYSQGPEAQTGGINGPVELGSIHPNLARLLCVSQPGQLWSPVQFGEWQVIVRLEKLIAVQLDEPMRQRLLNELFAAWLQEQMSQLSGLSC